MKDGRVAEASAFTASENQVTELAAQIQNLIPKSYDAIIITVTTLASSEAQKR